MEEQIREAKHYLTQHIVDKNEMTNRVFVSIQQKSNKTIGRSHIKNRRLNRPILISIITVLGICTATTTFAGSQLMKVVPEYFHADKNQQFGGSTSFDGDKGPYRIPSKTSLNNVKPDLNEYRKAVGFSDAPFPSIEGFSFSGGIRVTHWENPDYVWVNMVGTLGQSTVFFQAWHDLQAPLKVGGGSLVDEVNDDIKINDRQGKYLFYQGINSSTTQYVVWERNGWTSVLWVNSRANEHSKDLIVKMAASIDKSMIPK